jgi:hypothetical protein
MAVGIDDPGGIGWLLSILLVCVQNHVFTYGQVYKYELSRALVFKSP